MGLELQLLSVWLFMLALCLCVTVRAIRIRIQICMVVIEHISAGIQKPLAQQHDKRRQLRLAEPLGIETMQHQSRLAKVEDQKMVCSHLWSYRSLSGKTLTAMAAC